MGYPPDAIHFRHFAYDGCAFGKYAFNRCPTNTRRGTRWDLKVLTNSVDWTAVTSHKNYTSLEKKNDIHT